MDNRLNQDGPNIEDEVRQTAKKCGISALLAPFRHRPASDNRHRRHLEFPQLGPRRTIPWPFAPPTLPYGIGFSQTLLTDRSDATFETPQTMSQQAETLQQMQQKKQKT
jgi:hypothetical protein